MRAVVFFFLILVSCAFAKDSGMLPVLEEKFQETLSEYVGYVANWFQSFNDKHLGKTEVGRFLNYDEMKAKLAGTENHIEEGRHNKKIGATMMPLVFHIGAASTWMLLTTLLTAKTLAVGLALLVFKIAASSAKVASFFTQLKHSKEDHHEWASPWSPHYDHHDYHIPHNREHHGTITHHTPDWDWKPNDIPHNYHEHKSNGFHDSSNEHNYNSYEYKTILTYSVQDSNDASQDDDTHLEGAKKSLDSKVG